MSGIFDDLDDLVTEETLQPGVDFPEDPTPQGEWTELCAKCRGTGMFYGPSHYGKKCFACKGRGKFTYKTPPELRAKRKAAAKASKARRVAGWAEQHPDAAAWISAKAGKFGFATAMAEALAKYNHLTDNQLATVERLRLQDIERQAEFAKEREARAATAPVVDIGKVETAIATAVGAGLKRVVLRLAGFRFSPAPAHGKNTGAIYVYDTDREYLGKVQGGKFHRAHGCNEATEAEIVAVAADPEAAAIAYGRRFGQCACCGKELTNKLSIELGIGPICRGKFGWGG